MAVVVEVRGHKPRKYKRMGWKVWWEDVPLDMIPKLGMLQGGEINLSSCCHDAAGSIMLAPAVKNV